MSRPARVLGVVGARPQFIKAAAIHRAWRREIGPRRMALEWVHTGQHYDPLLSDAFFKEFKLPTPDHRLRPSNEAGLPQLTDMILGLAHVLKRSKPDAILAFGDTNSTLAAALAASFYNIPLAHVEAGLRSFNNAMPEERNRVLTDRLSTWLFCPTPRSVLQIKAEGITAKAYHVGDVMADLLIRAVASIPAAQPSEKYYLATIHRNTNTDDPVRLGRILTALNGLGRTVRFLMHPRTRARLNANPSLRRRTAALKHVRFCEPEPYGPMMALLKGASGVITDSGGVQKEAFLLSVPCVTLRDETEWVETVELGRNRLCGPSASAIRRSFVALERGWKKIVPTVYGCGDASSKILKILVREIRK